MAHIRQSKPDSGLGFQVKFLKIFFKLFPLRSAADRTFGSLNNSSSSSSSLLLSSLELSDTKFYEPQIAEC